MAKIQTKTKSKIKASRKKSKETEKQEIKKVLIKKALGYSLDEVVEEYVCDENGQVKLTKRKIAKKFVPPDMSAVKILLSEFDKKINLEELDANAFQDVVMAICGILIVFGVVKMPKQIKKEQEKQQEETNDKNSK